MGSKSFTYVELFLDYERENLRLYIIKIGCLLMKLKIFHKKKTSLMIFRQERFFFFNFEEFASKKLLLNLRNQN